MKHKLMVCNFLFARKMKYFLLFLLITVTVHWSVAPPVNQKSKNHDNENEVEDEEMVSLIYMIKIILLLIQHSYNKSFLHR